MDLGIEHLTCSRDRLETHAGQRFDPLIVGLAHAVDQPPPPPGRGVVQLGRVLALHPRPAALDYPLALP